MIIISKQISVRRKFNLAALQNQVSQPICPMSFSMGYLITKDHASNPRGVYLKGSYTTGLSESHALPTDETTVSTLKFLLSNVLRLDESSFEADCEAIRSKEIPNLDPFSFILGSVLCD